MSDELVLYGEKVTIYSLNKENVKSYLSVYKKASAFSELYERMPDFWEYTCKEFQNDIVSEKSVVERYLIVDKEDLSEYGYIEMDYSNPEMPNVNIAILKEHQRKGYAFEAARLLFDYILEKEAVRCIIWHAFSRNAASRRVAEKLGGIVIEGKNLIMEAMCAAGFNMDLIDERTIARTVTYEITRREYIEDITKHI